MISAIGDEADEVKCEVVRPATLCDFLPDAGSHFAQLTASRPRTSIWTQLYIESAPLRPTW